MRRLRLKSALIAANDHPDRGEPMDHVPGGALRRQAIGAACLRAYELLSQDVIGNDAYRVLVQGLDWAELSARGSRTSWTPGVTLA